jgi:hypothetical protein
MRLITVVLSLLAFASIASGQEVSWDKIKPETGEVIPAGGDTPFASVKITNPEAKPLTARVITIENPGITQATYAVTGQVRYEYVEGKGFLEMWSVFPDGRYFSRTLGTGSMAPITGSSEWRDFILPFSIQGGKARPTRLIISVVLPGKGTVCLGPLKLIQQPAAGLTVRGVPGQWWSPLAAAKWGGIIGGGFGGLIGLLGALIGWLAPRGKARGFVMTMWTVFLAASAGILIAGLVALGDRQPYWVFYPLLLTGFIGTVVMSPLTFVIRRTYDQAELRKMSAQDAGGR